jgi:dienelactone hydrolase
MGIETRFIDYRDGDTLLQGEMAWDPSIAAAPVVLVAHAWGGRGDFERGKAQWLAEQGYVGFAIDMYGKGKTGTTTEECTALMTPVVSDRAGLQRRIGRALEVAREQPEVSGPAAAIGFCFGGLCVLDLARSGADVAGVVSFHGLLMPPDNIDKPVISAKVLALHGYDDPMATPDAMISFSNEMSAAGADWQVHAYGGTLHAFTNPKANDHANGTVYSPTAERRALMAAADFLQEALEC